MTGQNNNFVGEGCLQAMIVVSPHDCAAIVSKSFIDSEEEGSEKEGLSAVFFSEDLDQKNQAALLAGNEVQYSGQPVGLVVAESRAACEEVLARIRIEYHSSPAVLDLVHAKAVRNKQGDPLCLEQGDVKRSLSECEITLDGKISIGSQCPVTSGILVAVATPTHNGKGLSVRVPTESPSRVRSCLAEVLALPESLINVQGQSMRGDAGGRSDESIRVACLAAVAAMKLKRTVRLELSAKQESELTGKRHEVEAVFQVACDQSGEISAIDIEVAMDVGAETGSGDAGASVLQRVLLNIDGAYGIANFRVTGSLYRSNGLTAKSIWAEGSAQGVLVMEDIIARVARKLGKTADSIRELNFYRAGKKEAVTPFGQKVDSELLSRLWIAALSTSKLHQRRKEIEKWNLSKAARKRGIAAVPVKMGAGDLGDVKSKARVLIQILADGSIVVRLAVMDIGDGLLLKVKQQVAEFFTVSADVLEVFEDEEARLGESMVAHGFDGASMIASAVRDACEQLDKRLKKWDHLEDLEQNKTKGFAKKVRQARLEGVDLTALGSSKLATSDWDCENHHGSPFAAFFYGVAVVEIELDAFTGEAQVIRADLFCQGSKRQDEGLGFERAQIARAYMMGQGWVLNEQADASFNAIPSLADAPQDFRIELIDMKGQDGVSSQTLYDEAPVAMAAATKEALKEAIFCYAPGSAIDFDLFLPIGPAQVMQVLKDVSKKAASLKMEKKKSGGKA